MIKYLPRTLFPCHIAFTLSEASYKKELKRLNVDLEEAGAFVKEGAHAQVTQLMNDKHGTIYIVTMLPDKARKMHRNQIAAMLAHEAVHVTDWIFEDAHEKYPGMETRAYLTQHILQNLLYLYDEMKGKKK